MHRPTALFPLTVEWEMVRLALALDIARRRLPAGPDVVASSLVLVTVKVAASAEAAPVMRLAARVSPPAAAIRRLLSSDDWTAPHCSSRLPWPSRGSGWMRGL